MGWYSRLRMGWNPDKVAVVAPDGVWTYGELDARALRAAGWLRRRGLTRGDVVALQMPRTLRFLELHLGALSAGIATLPLNPSYTSLEVEYYLRDSGARLAVLPAGEESSVCPFVQVNDELDAMLDAAEAVAPEAGLEDQLAVVLYTSGTTGKPKGAAILHKNLAATVEALHRAWRWSADDVLIHALPLFHVHGLFVGVHGSLRAGAAMRWMPRFQPERALDELADGGTIFMGVPTFYRRFLDLPAQRTWDLRRVRLFTSGSAPLPARDHVAFQERFGHPVVERYGLTEAGIVLSNPIDGPQKPGSVGIPLPDCAARIVEPETGVDVPEGAVGEVILRGPSIFAGYLHAAGPEASGIREGWLYTGDLATRDPDGWFRIVGRNKDMILSGGLNVYPAEVEQALLEVDGVAEAAVIGVPDPDLGERVVAVVVPGGPMDPLRAVAEVRERLAPYKCPKWIDVREDLPRNALGKVLKAELRRELGAPRVRAARADEAEQIAAWNVTMARETEGLALDHATTLSGVRRVFLEGRGARYFVAEQAGVPVGQCMVTSEWSDWRDAEVWWFQSVYVPPGWRRYGVFRRIHAHVVAEARAAGAAGVRLYVDRSNTTAQAVYRSLGMDGDHYAVFEAMFKPSP